MTPPAFQLTQPLYRDAAPLFRSAPLRTFGRAADGLEGHVVVAGAGRVGQFVAGMLHRLHVPVVAIELNQQRVDECKQQGIPVIYGDAAPGRAKGGGGGARALALVTTPAMKTTQSIAQQIRTLNPELHIVAPRPSNSWRYCTTSASTRWCSPNSRPGWRLRGRRCFPPRPAGAGGAALHRRRAPGPLRPSIRCTASTSEVRALEQARRLLEFTWSRAAGRQPLAGCSLGEAQIRSHTGDGGGDHAAWRVGMSNPAPWRCARRRRAGRARQPGELEGFTTLARPASGAGTYEEYCVEQEEATW